jgi:hypothetical protein
MRPRGASRGSSEGVNNGAVSLAAFAKKCLRHAKRRIPGVLYQEKSHAGLASALKKWLTKELGKLPPLTIVIITEMVEFQQLLGKGGDPLADSEAITYLVAPPRMVLLRTRLVEGLASKDSHAVAIMHHELDHIRRADEHTVLIRQFARQWPKRLLLLCMHAITEFQAERSVVEKRSVGWAKRGRMLGTDALRRAQHFHPAWTNSDLGTLYAYALAAAYPEFRPGRQFAGFVKELRKLTATPQDEFGAMALAWEICRLMGFDAYHANRVRCAYPGYSPAKHPSGGRTSPLPKKYPVGPQRRVFDLRVTQIARLAVVGGSAKQRLVVAIAVQGWLERRRERVMRCVTAHPARLVTSAAVRRFIRGILAQENIMMYRRGIFVEHCTTLITVGGILDAKAKCEPDVWKQALAPVWDEDSLLKVHYDAVFQIKGGEVPQDGWAGHPHLEPIWLMDGQLPNLSTLARPLEKFLKYRRHPYWDPGLPANNGKVTSPMYGGW